MNRIRATIVVATLLSAAWFVVRGARPADAVVAPSPCPGNVCTGTVSVGGKTVAYSYTQHIASGGQFRIRFDGGVYNTAGLVSFIVHDVPQFASTGYQADTDAFAMTESDVNPGRTAYERRDSNGCVNCTYDHVLSLQYGAMAPGTYAFSFTVIQNGDSGGRTALPFYVDAGAPSNGNESQTWNALSGMDNPCADTIDNDIDYVADCADVQCAGALGRILPPALCQAPELTCNDTFDNDADGTPDCLDADCNGRVGDPSGPGLCQYGNEFGVSTCGDNFDNDADGRIDCIDNLFDAAKGGNAGTICWKQSAYACPAVENCATGIDDDKDMSYSDAWDSVVTTGINCTDYDCAGNAACPASEHKTSGGADADAQCFDGLDNDLDNLVDCADVADCSGIVNPGNPGQVCYDSEFDLGNRYQYCANSFDDDGDGPMDCADTDCAGKFGNCGPCPTREDYTYAACADAKDNDSDGASNCADIDCMGNLGTLAGAAVCSAAESGTSQCADGFDNDRDGQADCADVGCAGTSGPLGATCQPAGETSCGDGKDNDADGRIDCADTGCAAVGSCAAKLWTDAACVAVPGYSAPTTFTSNAPTVTAVVQTAVHVNDIDSLHFIGSGTYPSVTIIVGDNTVASKRYPYAASSPGCTLIGPSAASFSLTAVAGAVVQIFNSSGTVSGFDFTLRCATPATPAAIKGYPVSISVLKSPGDVPEYGDVEFTTTLYEAVAPSVIEIEPEGAAAATITVPYGGVSSPASRRIRAVPSDPAVSSGICACDIEVDGLVSATDASCITNGMTFLADTTLSVRGRATDGAGNQGAWSAASAIGVNVTPTVTSELTVAQSAPFFRTDKKALGIDAQFITGGTFGPTACGVYLYPEGSTTPVFAPGPTMTVTAQVIGGLIVRCQGNVDIPDSIPDGRYDVVVRATDTTLDSVDTVRRTIYWCDSVPVAGEAEPTNGCQYADFDGDGAAEGLYTALYSTDVKSCDNCVNLANADQKDTNANGVGDVCEPNDVEYGRCEIDREVVCTHDAVPVCPDGELCCPEPAVADGTTMGQRCAADWGICTTGGEICLDDSECSGTDRCESLLYPWVQTVYGSVFSGKKITAAEAPPQNQFNATFCITAKDTILNFVSEEQGGCSAATDAAARYTLPNASNAYAGVLGKLDLAGLRSGRYGQVVQVPANGLDATLASYGYALGGKVFRVTGDTTVSAAVAAIIKNSSPDGSGTIFVDGGNLTVKGNVTYDVATSATPNELASIGWIVIDDGTGTKGNVYVDKAVTEFSGAIYAGGTDGFWSVAPPDADGPLPLKVNGMVMAHEFHLSRSFKSATQGSETFIYDGRAIANPPPGFADIARSLPTIGR